MPADMIQIMIPSSLAGGIVTLLIREVGAFLFRKKNGNGNGKLGHEEHEALCKVALSGLLTNKEHREMCHQKSDETNALIQRLFDKVDKVNTDVAFIRGKVEK